MDEGVAESEVEGSHVQRLRSGSELGLCGNRGGQGGWIVGSKESGER